MSNKSFFTEGLILGALVGSIAGLLFAPQSGEETRKKLKQLKEENQDLIDETKETTEKLIAKTKKSIEEGLAKLNKTLEERGLRREEEIISE